MAKKIVTKLERSRKNKKISRAKLSEVSGVPVRTIIEYENNPRCVISAWYFAFLARALDCDILDILEPIEGSKSEKFVETDKNTFEGKIEQLKNYVNLIKNAINGLEKIKFEKEKK